jgi:hypothetical protein
MGTSGGNHRYHRRPGWDWKEELRAIGEAVDIEEQK